MLFLNANRQKTYPFSHRVYDMRSVTVTKKIKVIGDLALKKMEQIANDYFPPDSKNLHEKLALVRQNPVTAKTHYLDIISATQENIKIILVILSLNDLFIFLALIEKKIGSNNLMDQHFDVLENVLKAENHLENTKNFINAFKKQMTAILDDQIVMGTPRKKTKSKIARPSSAPTISITQRPQSARHITGSKSFSAEPLSPITIIVMPKPSLTTTVLPFTQPAQTVTKKIKFDFLQHPIEYCKKQVGKAIGFFKKYSTGALFGSIFGVGICLVIGLITMALRTIDIFSFGLSIPATFSLNLMIISVFGLILGISVGTAIEKHMNKKTTSALPLTISPPAEAINVAPEKYAKRSHAATTVAVYKNLPHQYPQTINPHHQESQTTRTRQKPTRLHFPDISLPTQPHPPLIEQKSLPITSNTASNMI